MIYLDTSALVRFFTGDDEIKNAKVKQLLYKEKHICVSDVVFPELEYVLTKSYKKNRFDIISAFTFLASQSNILLTKTLRRALIIYDQTYLDMADCLIATSSIRGKLASFDKKLLHTTGVKSYWLEN